MRLFYLLISLTLIGAVVLPFYIKGPSGTPLMSVDQVVDDHTPDVLKVTDAYRWQDEHGNWQFSDEPPSHVSAQQFEIKPNHTAMGKEWQVEMPRSSANTTTTDMSDVIHNAYGGEAMEKAKAAAKLMEERNQILEDLTQR